MDWTFWVTVVAVVVICIVCMRFSTQRGVERKADKLQSSADVRDREEAEALRSVSRKMEDGYASNSLKPRW